VRIWIMYTTPMIAIFISVAYTNLYFLTVLIPLLVMFACLLVSISHSFNCTTDICICLSLVGTQNLQFAHCQEHRNNFSLGVTNTGN
jgi:hypothetical protein